MSYSLILTHKDGKQYPYTDPFTQKTAIFDTKHQADITKMVLSIQKGFDPFTIEVKEN